MADRPHIIRLRNPWQWRKGENSAHAHSAPSVLVARGFHRPTGLEPGARVLLCVHRVPGLGCVRLNDRLLTTDQSAGSDWESDISTQLQPRNYLQLEIAGQSEADLDIARESLASGAVRLEISGPEFGTPSPENQFSG